MTASVSSVRLDYFYGTEVKTGTFFRVPKVFETNEMYRAVSLEVKYLYSLMLDRVSISARNGWLDDGHVFIYFTVEEVKKCIRSGKNKAAQALHDMETLGLIQRKKQGQGKPARIFLKNIIEEKQEPTRSDVEETAIRTDADESATDIPAQTAEDFQNAADQNEETVTPVTAEQPVPVSAQNEKWDTPAPDAGTSRGLKIGSQDFPNRDSNYNNKNNTDPNHIDLSPCPLAAPSLYADCPWERDRGG